MGTTIQVKKVAGMLLLAMAAAYSQEQPAKVKVTVVDPLPPLVMPQRPSLSDAAATTVLPQKPNLGFGQATTGLSKQPGLTKGGDIPESMTEVPTTPAIAGKDERARRNHDEAAAPLNSIRLQLMRWDSPHGVYMNDLRDSILAADAAGESAERDRLFAIYRTWAEKYLNQDSTTWSKDRLYPGGTPTKQAE
jgi:hypothetical protein